MFNTYYRAYKADLQVYRLREAGLDTRKTLGEFVKKKRIQKSWTQDKLASETGINTRFLQKIEAGDGTPSLVTIFKLAAALGITPDKIITPVWREWKKAKR